MDPAPCLVAWITDRCMLDRQSVERLCVMGALAAVWLDWIEQSD